MKCIILRGISGCGKSTYAETLTNNKEYIVSADHFRYVNGVYVFDPKQNSLCHDKCFQAFFDLLKYAEFDSTIVVDNTNLCQFEYAPYYRLAEMSYLKKVTLQTIYCDPVVAAKRNNNRAPFSVVLEQYKTLMDKANNPPPWWNHDVITF